MKAGSLNGSFVEPLTRRELEILHLLIEKYSNSQIGEKLTLAPSSVKWYVKQIYAKLGVNERDQVAGRAGELGLVPQDQPGSPPIHNLPSSKTPFIGRKGQIEQIRRMVIDSNYRLITLTGAGGVGKTRLALKIAESLTTVFKHGVWLVELASVYDPNLVDQTIAAVLGLQGDHGRAAIDVLRNHLREKKLLLVLDNCEQVVDACSRLVESLLQYCPDLHILATSREVFDIEGEIPFTVPSLTFPDRSHPKDIEGLPQYEAVRLFVERARSFIPEFSIIETNAAPIVRICQRLDGIPLALELAAARVKVLGVDQIATHLENSFQLLAGGYRTALSRHQTMRESINWSYRLLSETERILLRRFSIFAGGWTLDAAEGICADGTIPAYMVIDLLTQLVDKSLVTVKKDTSEGMRYTLMEVIDDFAYEKLLEADESQAMHDNHLHYFLNLAETAESYLQGQEQVKWLDRLEHELPNLRVALDSGLKTNSIAELRLASAITLFWQIRGHLSEGLRWLSKGLKSTSFDDQSQAFAAEVENTAQRRLIHAKSLAAIGYLWKMGTEFKKAKIVLEDSLAVYRDMGKEEQTGLAFPLLQLSGCATALGDYRQANAYATESLAYYQEMGDSFGISECLSALGNNETDPVRAKNLFLEALEMKREIGDINGMGYILQQLCEITVYETDFQQAYGWLQESTEIYQKVGNKRSFINCLYNSAWIAWVTGDYPLAIQRINESILLSQDLEEKMELSRGWLMRSDIKLSQGNILECINDIHTACKIGQEMGYQAILASAQVKQGRLALIQGQFDQAYKILHETIPLSRSLDKKTTMAFNLYNLGRVAFEQHDLSAAKDFFTQSIQLFFEMNFWYWEYIAYPLEGLARVLLLQGHADYAARLYGAAARLFQRLVNTLSPRERQWREEDLAAIRKQLGEEAYQQQWEEGYAWTAEEILTGIR